MAGYRESTTDQPCDRHVDDPAGYYNLSHEFGRSADQEQNFKSTTAFTLHFGSGSCSRFGSDALFGCRAQPALTAGHSAPGGVAPTCWN